MLKLLADIIFLSFMSLATVTFLTTPTHAMALADQPTQPADDMSAAQKDFTTLTAMIEATQAKFESLKQLSGAFGLNYGVATNPQPRRRALKQDVEAYVNHLRSMQQDVQFMQASDRYLKQWLKDAARGMMP